MAITVVIEPTVNAVSGLETRFTASGPFVLYGDGFAGDERCSLERLGPSGTYIKACSKKGMIKVGAYPNMVYVDAPGSYQLVKSATRAAASVGIQSSHTLELLIDTDEYWELKMTEIFGRPDTIGIWYDPQDLSTLFQDAEGTLPVYRPGTGQVDPPVGLMMDKSGGGYHASQNTTTARPTLSGRYNLLTATETLATQSVTTAATDYTLSFSGEGTVTLSGTATDTYTEGTHTVTCTAGTLTCTVDGSVTEADLRAKRDGSDLPAYQAVVDADTYDTEGFPLYLKFDKVDDGMFCQVPEGGITGTLFLATTRGTASYGVSIPGGGWSLGNAYNPLGDVVSAVLFDRALNDAEKALLKVFGIGKGGTEFGAETSFLLAYRGWSHLVDFPLIDTSSGTSFQTAWYSCSGLTSFPLLDVSSGTAFNYAWQGCSGLTSFSANFFDNCLATAFTDAFTDTNLSQESIDGILVSINSNATSNGTFDQSGGSAPSAAGKAAIMAMRSRGWTVTFTGEFDGEPVFSFDLDSVDSFSFDLQTKFDTAPVLVDWGDGTQSTHAGTTDQTASHTYEVSGTYAVKVYGIDESVLTKFSTSADGMSGDLVMPAGMTYFVCAGANTLSGTLSLPSGMTYFVCQGSNTLSGYTPSTKASDQERFTLTGQNTMSAEDVDNILIDYDAAGGTWAEPKEITIQGNAEDRTSDSDAAYDSLAIKLDTLDVD